MTNKKGYFSFLLVIMLVAIILIILQANIESRKYTQTEALQLKRMQSIATNAKEVIHELARQGAISGFSEYIASIGGDYLKIRKDELRKKITEKVHEKLSLLDGYKFSDDFDVYIWCGSNINDNEDTFKPLITGIKTEQNVNFTSDLEIYSIASPFCEYIAQVSLADDLHSIDDLVSVKLGSENTRNEIFNSDDSNLVKSYQSVIGISIYSQKFNMSGIYFFPTGLNVLN